MCHTHADLEVAGVGRLITEQDEVEGTVGFEDSDVAASTAATVASGATLSTYGNRVVGTALTLQGGATLGNLGGGTGLAPAPAFESIHDLCFFGERGALTPTGDLILESAAWRERLFTVDTCWRTSKKRAQRQTHA